MGGQHEMKHAPVLVLLIAFAWTPSFSQLAEKEPSVVLELGAASSRSLTEHQSSFGPTVAIEITPIENWLELEAGVTPLFQRHSTEWSADFLFKKPWTFSTTKEFMLGVGPEWIHSNTSGIKSNSVAIEVVPDLMFWSSARHKFGWYLEPGYEYKYGRAREHSLGIAGGLLIGLPWK